MTGGDAPRHRRGCRSRSDAGRTTPWAVCAVVTLLVAAGCESEGGTVVPRITSPTISIECGESRWNPTAGTFVMDVSFSDPEGVDTGSLTVTLNGADVLPLLSVTGEGATGTIPGIPSCPGVHVRASIKNSRGVSGTATCDLDAVLLAFPLTGSTMNNPLLGAVFTYDSRTDSSTFSVIFNGADITSRCSGTSTSAVCTLETYITPPGSGGLRAIRCFSGGGACCMVSSLFTFVPPVPEVTIRSPGQYSSVLDVPVDLFFEDPSRVLGLGATTASVDGASITSTLAYTIGATIPGFPLSPTSFTATATAPVSAGAHVLRASATDPVYSQTGSASRSFTVDTTPPAIAIVSPANGTSSPPYFIEKDVTIPLSISYSDSGSGIDLSSLTVLLVGSGTISASASPGGATGSLLLGIPTSAGSGGTGNFVIEAGIRDRAGNLGQAGSSITLTLAQLGAGSADVAAGTTFSIPINVYLDPGQSFGLGSYDIAISMNTSIVGFVSASGSNPSDPAYAPSFASPAVNVSVIPGAPELVGSNSLGSNATIPMGVINVINLNLRALNPGSSSITLSIVSLLDSTGAPIPQARIQAGLVTVAP